MKIGKQADNSFIYAFCFLRKLKAIALNIFPVGDAMNDSTFKLGQRIVGNIF